MIPYYAVLSPSVVVDIHNYTSIYIYHYMQYHIINHVNRLDTRHFYVSHILHYMT